jgi:hypothetical protein
MKLIHQRNLVFVGNRNSRATVQWAGVAIGFAAFVIALTAASMFGWYVLSLITGANFGGGLAACFSLSIGGAAAAVIIVVNGTLRRPLSELPSLD